MSEPPHDPTSGAPSEPPVAPAPHYIPWVTVVLAAANIAVWLVTIGLGADPLTPSAQWMFEHGGNAGPFTLAGEEWRIVTSMFLHYGIVHLAMNMVGLVGGGRLVERTYGRRSFFAIYVTSGLAGGLASALRTGVVSAGASGAIFGSLGSLGAFYLLHRDRMDRAVAKEASGLLIYVAYNVVFGFTQPGIDMYAHLGGLAAGFVVGIALVGRGQRAPRMRRTGLVSALAIGIVVSGILLAPTAGVVPPWAAFAHGQVVHYQDGATEAEAKATGDALIALEYFDNEPTGSAITVVVRRHEGHAVVVFVVQDRALDPSATLLHHQFHELAEGLSKRAFAGQPVDIWLADAVLHERIKLLWSERPQKIATSGDADVRFHSGATEKQATDVYRTLVAHDYFTARGSVDVGLERGRPVVSLFVESDALASAEIHVRYYVLLHQLSRGAFAGKPIDLWLVDPLSSSVKKLRWEDSPGPPVEVDKGKVVQYRRGGTASEARAVAEVFDEFFATSDEATVFVLRENGRHVVTLVVQDWVFESDDHITWYHEHAGRLSRRAFANEPVDIWVANGAYEPRVKLTWETRPR